MQAYSVRTLIERDFEGESPDCVLESMPGLYGPELLVPGVIATALPLRLSPGVLAPGLAGLLSGPSRPSIAGNET